MRWRSSLSVYFKRFLLMLGRGGLECCCTPPNRRVVQRPQANPE